MPTGSVVYVGRGSFRMETVDFGDDGTQGIVRAAPVVTTAPYGIDTRDEGRVIVDLTHDLDRAVSSASFRAPALDSLFGSQDEVTMLVAPTGQASLQPEAPAGLRMSRAALASVVALFFTGGLATASLTLQRRVPALPPAPVMVETPFKVTAVAEPVVEPQAEPAVAEPAVTELATIQVAAPIKIRVQKKAPQVIAAATGSTTSAGLETPGARWVDPFAD